MLADIVDNETKSWMVEQERYNDPEQTDIRQQRAISQGAES
jgi:hypothetical protein